MVALHEKMQTMMNLQDTEQSLPRRSPWWTAWTTAWWVETRTRPRLRSRWTI